MINPLYLPCQAHEKVFWQGFHGNSLSLALYLAAQRSEAPLLYIAEDNLAAQHLALQLQFFNPDQALWINVFSDWETLPYDGFSPHPDIISERLTILSRLPFLKKGILIVAVSTLMHRLPPRNFFVGQLFSLKKGETFDLSKTREQLEQTGYRCVDQVYQHGEFSVRGSLFDLFPMGSSVPYRIDLFDNEVDSIRIFDPETQRSLTQVEAIDILPAHEFPFDEKAIALFRKNWRTAFEGNPLTMPVYQDISQGLTPAGIEYYATLFFENNHTLFDYFSQNSVVVYSEKINVLAEQFWREIKTRHDQLCHDVTRPILTPKTIFVPVEEVFERINQFPDVILLEAGKEKPQADAFQTQALPDLTVDPRLVQPWQRLLSFIQEYPARILFCAETKGRTTIFHEALSSLGIDADLVSSWADFLKTENRFAIITAPFDQGFWLKSPDILVVSEAYLLGQPAIKQKRVKGSQVDADAIIRHLSELRVGAPVVHLQHGVGRYVGLQTLLVNGIESEFLSLEYEGGDKLYVPVSSLNLISRYSGLDADHAPLHRLGTDQWQKAKRKAKEQICDVAAELLQVYAMRAANKGYEFTHPAADYEAFAAAFPFEETEDQEKAIASVLEDMTSDRKMDRLVCGDVGFGKTEIAMRAAFLAVQSQKQVAILVPTTLLAQQHYETFQSRFAQWPVQIDVLSRFRSSKQQDSSLEKVSEGKVDILIGTHRLLQKDIQFKNLGLVIIDEEHRFGVQQKDKLKKLRAEVDILTLTATPIPRTLNMSLSGIRDLSIIATPPAKRLSIKTFVREKNSALIREAILREIYRGGQVYFLHNKVETIEPTLTALQKLVPEALMGLAHGQMHERQLEKVMSDFYHRRFNVLVCTTIIETGIDIPTANTIIMEEANKFGLAQLHQLRGRVGRSHHQAYAYLLVSSFKGITPDAKKRLDAIASLEDLGAGFTLATHDLEIRGAGELLGEEQSGNMAAIGFSLYMELLDKAVTALKAGKALTASLEEEKQVEVDLQIPAILPETYVPDVNGRLILYKRIASATSELALKALQIEFIDRFGLLPVATKNLFEIALLKLMAMKMGIQKIEVYPKGGRIEFTEKPQINIDKLILKINSSQGRFYFEGPSRVKFSYETLSGEQRLVFIKALLVELQ